MSEKDDFRQGITVSLRERQGQPKGLRVTRQDPPVLAAPGAPRARKRASGGDKGRWTDGSPAPYVPGDARPRSRSARGKAAPPPPCFPTYRAADIHGVLFGIAARHRGEQAVADNAARRLTRSTILDRLASCPNLALGYEKEIHRSNRNNIDCATFFAA